eukprot:TRINITY_DN37780_c0_g1_i1.p1 TRINITY_DN37780_c0_g1~~TRINITY_DN37780_c0_g1_i1.p1  ORF type:complete len:593 (+),score=99.41 TRINITY_DN37780_c0_g1_i1:65-1843(+)
MWTRQSFGKLILGLLLYRQCTRWLGQTAFATSFLLPSQRSLLGWSPIEHAAKTTQGRERPSMVPVSAVAAAASTFAVGLLMRTSRSCLQRSRHVAAASLVPTAPDPGAAASTELGTPTETNDSGGGSSPYHFGIETAAHAEWAMNVKMTKIGLSKVAELEQSGLIDTRIATTIKVLRNPIDLMDDKYRQLDMDRPAIANIVAVPGILEILVGAGWVEAGDDFLILPANAPRELTEEAVAGLRAEQQRRARVARESTPDASERRFNPWDGKVYTLAQLEKALRIYSRAEIHQHWKERCRPVASSSGVEGVTGAEESPQVVAWRKVWKVKSLERMWTSADIGHLHAISGALYAFAGATFLLDIAVYDLAILNGHTWSRLLPLEVGLGCLALGAINAVSGLQPRLLSRTPADLMRSLGVSQDGDLKSGGFVNASGFYLVLAYQCLRGVAPDLAPLDGAVGLVTVLLILHQAFILNAWVGTGKLHRVDALLVPGVFNLPMTLHLLTGGQAWMEQLSARYPAWPELCFSGNFALAWSCAMVTFILSLYERRVISLEMRGLLMMLLPVVVFATVLMQTAVLVPEWLGSDFMVMLSLSP